MRKKNRRLNADDGGKNVLYLLGTILGISVIAFIITFISYNNSSTMDTKEIADLVTNTIQNEISEEASSKISKTIEEVKNEAEEAENQLNNIAVVEEENAIVQNNIVETTNSMANDTTDNNRVEPQEQSNETTEETSTTAQVTKKLEFIMPVDGKILREFAKDTLVYSDTLKEWITHLGIDIESEKTTVVKAAEDGEVVAIKTDPRYGITVMIKHSDGFETRYANLLTSEYVKVGDMVVKGQTVGTVGNSATFEIADKYHLHFEMLKDGEYVDPNMYIK